jgi:hypothetical protein
MVNARHGEKRKADRLVVETSERKRPLGRPRRRWNNNIKKGLKEIGWEGVDWMGKRGRIL